LPRGLRRTAGTIELGGRNLCTLSEGEMRGIRGRRVAMIFQDALAALSPAYPVGEQIAEVLRLHLALRRRPARARAIELLGEVGIPAPAVRQANYPHQFSGGERQRIALALALACDPELIIADEATTGLDPTVRAQILELWRREQERRGTAFLVISHDLPLVGRIADRVAVLQAGRVVEAGPAAEVLAHPRHLYTQALLKTAAERSEPAHALGPVLLEADAVGKVYSPRAGVFRIGRAGVRALDGVSLQIREGEIVAVVGESGSGKTTLARILAQLLTPSTGMVRFRGREVRRFSRREWARLRREVQPVFQDPAASLDPRMRAGEIVLEGPRLYRLARPAAMEQLCGELFAKVGLDPKLAQRFPHELSGGERQRLCIARALAVQPRVLIADEPFSSLDATVQRQVAELLLSLRERTGIALLIVSHDLRAVGRLSDRVVVLRHGSVVEDGPTASVFTAPRHPYTRALLADGG
jgi:peptide/nickel transport system ATP-binding protein